MMDEEFTYDLYDNTDISDVYQLDDLVSDPEHVTGSSEPDSSGAGTGADPIDYSEYFDTLLLYTESQLESDDTVISGIKKNNDLLSALLIVLIAFLAFTIFRKLFDQF